jgi:hypothetical protein
MHGLHSAAACIEQAALTYAVKHVLQGYLRLLCCTCSMIACHAVACHDVHASVARDVVVQRGVEPISHVATHCPLLAAVARRCVKCCMLV